jgi:AcrR family transcriptional regulator
MSESAPPPEPFRVRVQQLLHDSVLDAARRRSLEQDWADIRLSDIADEVGVSRQTIYNLFGTKDQLGEALFMREAATYLDGLLARLDGAATLESAFRSALGWALAEARGNVALNRALDMARQGELDTLLPYLTVQVDVLLGPLRERLTQEAVAGWPELGADRLAVGLDAALRLVVSHLMSPSSTPEDQFLDLVVALACGQRS